MRIDKNYAQNPINKHQEQNVRAEKVQADEIKKNNSGDLVEVDLEALAEVKQKAEAANSRLKALVKELLARQDMTFKAALKDSGELEVDQKAVQEAEALIAEDGEYGVEAVSDRIVSFAKAISGGDKSKYETLKKAVADGFAEAKKALGGSLPEISERTLELTMEKLEAWASS